MSIKREYHPAEGVLIVWFAISLLVFLVFNGTRIDSRSVGVRNQIYASGLIFEIFSTFF